MILAPDKPSTGSLLDQIVEAKTSRTSARTEPTSGLDTSPPTDDRPFFFQLRSARAWLHPFASLFREARGGVLGGNAAAMFQLLVTLIAVLVAVSSFSVRLW